MSIVRTIINKIINIYIYFLKYINKYILKNNQQINNIIRINYKMTQNITFSNSINENEHSSFDIEEEKQHKNREPERNDEEE